MYPVKQKKVEYIMLELKIVLILMKTDQVVLKIGIS